MKRCTHCDRTLPTEAFARHRGKSDGLGSWCKECVNARDRNYQHSDNRLRPYEFAELRYRPIEQILEALTCRQLGQALGLNKDTARQIKNDPGAHVDTPLELDEMKIRKIHTWLDGPR